MPQFKSRRLILYTIALVNFTHIIDGMLIMPLGDIFINEFDITPGQYSILVSAYAFAAFISCLGGMLLMDRYDRKTVLLFLYTGFGIGTLACGFADSYISLLMLRLFTGFFGGVLGAMALSIVSDLYLFKERGAAMGVLFAAFSAASALGVPMGIYLAAKGNWQLPFIVLGIFALVVSSFIFFFFPNMKSHLSQQSDKLNVYKTITSITTDSNQVAALIGGFVLIIAHFLIIPFISPFLINNVGLTQMEITYQFLFGGLATIVSSPIIGKLTDKLGVMPVFISVMILSWIPTLLITHMETAPLTLAISYTTLFFIFASGRMISPNTIITAAAGSNNRGSFMSVKSALQQFAIGSSSILAGLIVIKDEITGLYMNYQYVGYLSIGMCIIAIWLISRIRVAEGN